MRNRFSPHCSAIDKPVRPRTVIAIGKLNVQAILVRID
jgi:hypothetical protein